MNRRDFFKASLAVGAVGLLRPLYTHAAQVQNNLFQDAPVKIGDTNGGIAGLNSWNVAAGDMPVQLTEVTTPTYLRPSGTTKVLRLQVGLGTTTTTINIEWTINQILATQDCVGFMYYCASAVNPAFTCRIHLVETAAYSNYFQHEMAAQYPNVGQLGWNAPVSALNAPFSTTGSPSLNNTFQRMRIQIALLATNAVDLYICPVFLKVRQAPTFVFCFDDNSTSQYTEGFPYMTAQGLKGSLAVQTQAGSGMSVANMQEMHTAGWSMHNHTQTHTNLGAVGLETALNEVRLAQATLNANGLTRGRDIIIYPNGSTNDTLEAALIQMGYRGGGAIVNGQPEHPLDGFANPMRLNRRATDISISLATLQQRIDGTINTGGVLVLYTHQILVGAGAGDTERATFRGLVDYLAPLHHAGVCHVTTLSELYERTRGRRPRNY